MDTPGWHARRKAAQEEESALPPSRGPDGHFRPLESVEPTEDAVIGGWVFSPPRPSSPHPTQLDTGGNLKIEIEAPSPPPSLSPYLRQTGYPFVHQSSILDPPNQHVPLPLDGTPLSKLGPVERSQELNFKRRMMDPYLQLMCGPLLRYDTIDEHGMWHGAVLIVTADAESTYEPYPSLAYSGTHKIIDSLHQQHSVRSVGQEELGPHPTDLMAQHNPRQEDNEHVEGPNLVQGQIYDSSYRFRFPILK